MKLKQLIEELQTILNSDKEAENLEVEVSSDEEGNSFSPVSQIEMGPDEDGRKVVTIWP
jgi:hypothetical protein